jgi:hypothetical protein
MKKTTKSNFRVVVGPRRLGDYGFCSMSDRLIHGDDVEKINSLYKERCEEIVDQIRRHVDNVGDASVEYDTNVVCSHCGRDWDESPDDTDPYFPKGSPYCCDAAITEWKHLLDNKIKA